MDINIADKDIMMYLEAGRDKILGTINKSQQMTPDAEQCFSALDFIINEQNNALKEDEENLTKIKEELKELIDDIVKILNIRLN